MNSTKYNRDYMRKKRKVRKMLGVCITCGGSEMKSKTVCLNCYERDKGRIRVKKTIKKDTTT
jgi:hypothetical protein